MWNSWKWRKVKAKGSRNLDLHPKRLRPNPGCHCLVSGQACGWGSGYESKNQRALSTMHRKGMKVCSHAHGPLLLILRALGYLDGGCRSPTGPGTQLQGSGKHLRHSRGGLSSTDVQKQPTVFFLVCEYVKKISCGRIFRGSVCSALHDHR